MKKNFFYRKWEHWVQPKWLGKHSKVTYAFVELFYSENVNQDL